MTDEAIEKIKSMIASGALRPGDRLPKESGPTAGLDLSRNPLREAVRHILEPAATGTRRRRGGGAETARRRRGGGAEAATLHIASVERWPRSTLRSGGDLRVFGHGERGSHPFTPSCKGAASAPAARRKVGGSGEGTSEGGAG